MGHEGRCEWSVCVGSTVMCLGGGGRQIGLLE